MMSKVTGWGSSRGDEGYLEGRGDKKGDERFDL